METAIKFVQSVG